MNPHLEVPQRNKPRGARIAVILGVVLAAAGGDALAQGKPGISRNRPSKDDLVRKAEELKEIVPRLKDAALSEEDSAREESARRAIKIVEEAMGSELQAVLDAEAKRLTDGKQTPASEKLEAVRRITEKVKTEAPEEVRAILDGVSAGLTEGDDPPEDGDADRSVDRFDGMVVRTTDGKTLKVPGIQVAALFTGAVVPVEGNGPPPGPKPAPKAKRLTKEQAKAESRKVEIECEGGAVFSATGQIEDGGEGKKGGAPIVIFEDNVVVRSGDTLILCDKLIVYMKEGGAPMNDAAGGAGGAGGAGAAGAAGAAPGNPVGVNGIERAVATGREVIVQKTLPDGTRKLGKARHVTYVDATKDVVLRDWPQVQEGPNLQKATSADTVMTISESGKMTSVGPTSSAFVPEADAIPTTKPK